MTGIEKVKHRLKSIPAGEPFSANLFRSVTSADNAKQILSRLVKSGAIKRVARGVFVKPSIIENVGDVSPSTKEIAKTLAQTTGETIMVHGAEAARQLQLTTQVPMQLIFYTNGNSRKLTIANKTVELKHVNPSKLLGAGTRVGTVISALNYLGKKNVTIETIKKISRQLSSESFKCVLKEIKNMPAWMSTLFYYYQQEENKKNHE